MLNIHKIHHVAIICSDYERSKHFYTHVLGFKIKAETYRANRQSYKLDLEINEHYQIELFSFPNPPQRVSNPEAVGLRHIAFEVENIEETHSVLGRQGIVCEAIRIDEYTGKAFFFIADPDHLPIEFYAC